MDTLLVPMERLLQDPGIQDWIRDRITLRLTPSGQLAIASTRWTWAFRNLKDPILLISYAGEALLCHSELYSELIKLTEFVRMMTGFSQITIGGSDVTIFCRFDRSTSPNRWLYESTPCGGFPA